VEHQQKLKQISLEALDEILLYLNKTTKGESKATVDPVDTQAPNGKNNTMPV